MAQFQGLGGLGKTPFLAGELVSPQWFKWLNLIAPRLTGPATNDAPTSSTAAGTMNEIRHDGNFLYVCTATNTWKRIALTSF